MGKDADVGKDGKDRRQEGLGDDRELGGWMASPIP